MSIMKTNFTGTDHIIDRRVLVTFVSEMAYTTVGSDLNGRPTTLADELAYIAKRIARADVCSLAGAPDPYRHSRLAFSIAELEEEEKAIRIEKNYRAAFMKILWLNSISRRASCGVFLTRRVSKENFDDVQCVVNEFEAAIRYASITKVTEVTAAV